MNQLAPSLPTTTPLLGASLAAARLPTNTARQHAVHRWFNFIAGFSPELVWHCCSRVTREGGRLLDPFAGCGTALVAALQQGLDAVGYEPHPVFARAARAKVCRASWRQVDRIESTILAGLKKPYAATRLPEAPREFLGKLFDGDVLGPLLGARQALGDAGYAENDLAFLMLSRILESCSRSQTDGIYKAPTTHKRAHPPEDTCRDLARVIRTDVTDWSAKEHAEIHQKSSEKMSEVKTESIDIVVTSPPYLNNFDFAEMTRMHLYFWGMADSWGSITRDVRSRLVVNTTTALAGHKDKDKQDEYRAWIPSPLHAELHRLVGELRQKRAEKAGKKEYDFLVYPYFAQMTSILRECRRVLRRDAEIHIMVADAALYGVHISTPQFLSQVMDNLGFRDTTCTQVRRRGHRWILDKRDGSPIGLGEYHVHARK